MTEVSTAKNALIRHNGAGTNQRQALDRAAGSFSDAANEASRSAVEVLGDRRSDTLTKGRFANCEDLQMNSPALDR
jgi:hypothetical protein